MALRYLCCGFFSGLYLVQGKLMITLDAADHILLLGD